MGVRVKSEDLQKIKSLSEFGMGKSQNQIEAEQPRKEEPMQYPVRSGYRPSPPSMDAGYNINEGLNPWDISMPKVPAILICPQCKGDVDDETLPSGEKSAFARCPKCEMGYFIFELIKNKSWRRKFENQASEDAPT